MSRVKLDLSQIAPNGLALGRNKGKVHFVPYALPGEKVVISVMKDRKNWAVGRLEEIIEPSPQRVRPACPHFGPEGCGGCHWQHIDYDAQLAFKTDVIREQFERIGGLHQADIKPTKAAGDRWSYRNHVQLHRLDDGVGFISADQKRIVTLSQCPIMHPLVERMLPELNIRGLAFDRVSLRAGINTGDRLVMYEVKNVDTVCSKEDFSFNSVCWTGNRVKTLFGNDCIQEVVAGISYRISAPSFFQVNTSGAEILVESVKKYLEPESTLHLLDLYAGVGLFSIALAPGFDRVTAVESNTWAVADAVWNVKSAGLANVLFEKGDVERILSDLRKEFDAVVADPPRKGLSRDIIRQLCRLRPSKLVYVSCDPATLARDARILVDCGFHLVEVQPLDIFPQTYHIECVALFEINLRPYDKTVCTKTKKTKKIVD